MAHTHPHGFPSLGEEEKEGLHREVCSASCAEEGPFGPMQRYMRNKEWGTAPVVPMKPL